MAFSRRLSVCRSGSILKVVQFFTPFLFHFKDYLYGAAVINFDENFFVFGGATNRGSTDVIARFHSKTFKWSMVGELNAPREGHGAIVIDGEFLVVGGYSEFTWQMKSERCAWIGDQVVCTEQTSTLYYYTYWPELFLIKA